MLQLIIGLLKSPALLVGLLACVGLILQRKSWSDIVKGSIKTSLGFVILMGGAGILVQSLEPLGQMFEHAFQVQGVVPNNEAIVALATGQFGSQTAFVMMGAMAVNLLIARFTVFKYIFLTGHHTFYMSAMVVVILSTVTESGPSIVFMGSVVVGFLMAVMPALAQPFMRKITESDDIALGHFGTLGYVLSGLVGQATGKGSTSTENLNLPKGLSFLRDSSVTITLTMLVIFLAVGVAAGPHFIESEISQGDHWIGYLIVQAFVFASGVFVILQGVKLLIAEIVPAFQGISEKLVPHAKPALDCPIVFNYAPNAVTIGFLCSFVGGVIGLGMLGALNATLILPGVVPHFFTGATAGVFGNATGGRRGAILGSLVNGLLITFLPVLLLPVLGDLGFANTTFSDSDFGAVGILLGFLAQNFAWGTMSIIVFIGCVLVLLIPSVWAARKSLTGNKR